MRRGFILIFILAIIVNPWEIRGQESDASFSQPISQTPAALSLLYNKVIVYLREGGFVSGLLAGVESDKLVLRVKDKDKKIPYPNLAKVIIETKKNTSANIFGGMLVGTYLGTLLSYSAKYQPTAYMESFRDLESPMLFLTLYNSIYAAAGGLLGILIGNAIDKGERTFDFTGSEGKRHAQWEKLQRFVLTGYAHQKKVHLSTQAGYVYSRVSDRYIALLEDYDYIMIYPWRDYDSGEEAINFNLLRKLQITISPLSNAEIGVALFWLGEPFLGRGKYQAEESYELTQSINTKGYYAIGIYKPLLERMPQRINWNVGIGIGAAKIDFSLGTIFNPGFYHHISKTRLSGVIFTELNFYLRDSLSFGLTADYVFVPPENVPEIPQCGMPAKKLWMGSGSIGFNFGFHF